MRVLLNTIALDPHRWTADKIPAHDLNQLLPLIGKSIFRHLELWPYHVSRKGSDEVKAMADSARVLGLDFPVFGMYPVFHEKGPRGDDALREAIRLLDHAKILGSKLIKFFMGARKGSEIGASELARTTRRMSEWIQAGHAKGFRFAAEMHEGTLFDPYEWGKTFLAEHPELEIKTCFQPYDFTDTDEALRLIGDRGGAIVHAHFQGRNKDGFSLLSEAAIDYRRVIPGLKSASPDFIPSIEFVRRGFPRGGAPFDFDGALSDAEADARFIESILNTCS